MSRLPIRLRVTLGFAVAMGVVLAAVGAFLYARVGSALAEQIDDGLELRAATLAPLVREGRAVPPADEESLAQVFPGGRLPPDALVSAADVPRPGEEPRLVTRDRIPAFGDAAGRLLVTRAGADVLVVGSSLEDREESLHELLAQLLVVGPLALALATLVGYAVAGAALGPVEAMRLRAEEVSSERAGQQLPLPAARDEIRRLGETLNAMLGRLEAAIARERRFVADASHELRTPLALLRTELELALRQPRSPDELRAALASAAEEAERLTRLAEDLLVLARIDEGGLPLRRERLDAADLLEAVARRFSPRAEASGRRLEVAGETGLAITGDRLRLEQALGNLVDNALRHGRGTVRLALARRDRLVELRVGDEGPGFPRPFLALAFGRFARADEARGGGSTGLGLSIVEAIARAHGGSAQATNEGDRGASVSLFLPLA